MAVVLRVGRLVTKLLDLRSIVELDKFQTALPNHWAVSLSSCGLAMSPRALDLQVRQRAFATKAVR